MINPQDQPVRMCKAGKVHGAGKELLPLDQSAFGLKVSFPMSSVVISVVSNHDSVIFTSVILLMYMTGVNLYTLNNVHRFSKL